METIAVVSALAPFLLLLTPYQHPHLSSMLHTSNQPTFIIIFILDHSFLHIPLLLIEFAHTCLQTHLSVPDRTKHESALGSFNTLTTQIRNHVINCMYTIQL